MLCPLVPWGVMERAELPVAEITPAVDDEIEYDYAPESAAPVEQPQVSSLIAIIRIVGVLAMGICVSLGLFLMLIGVDGVIIGVPLVLAAVPVYYGMQLAERVAGPHDAGAPAE
jgi:hypothetical protein